MKPVQSTMAILLGASVLAVSPVASASPSPNTSTVVAVDDTAGKLNQLPARAKRIVTAASEYFGLTSVKIVTEGYHPDSWNLVIENQSEQTNKNRNAPSSIHMTFSGKNSKLLQLDTYWDQKKSTLAPNKTEALKSAANFADQVFEQSLIASNDADLQPDDFDFFTVPLYPTKDGIPVQKAVATVTVDPVGRILSFKRMSEEVDLQKLPAATGLLSLEQLKQQIGKELQVDLVFNAQQQRFQYIPKFPTWYDAKTGAASLSKYEDKEEIVNITAASQASKALTSENVKQIGDAYLGLSEDKLTVSESRESIPGALPKRTYTLKDGMNEVVVKVDEKSGELVSISHLGEQNEQTPKEAFREDAKQLTLRFIENYVPIPADKYVVHERYRSEKQMELAIYPLYGEVRAAVPYVTVTFDLQRNGVTSLEASMYPMPTVSTSTVLSKEEVIKALVNRLDVEKSYVYANDWDQKSSSAKLVYLPTNKTKSLIVDAVTGELIHTNH